MHFTGVNSTVPDTDLQRERILYDALSNQKLSLILFPTEKCNFRCTYCYEDFAIGRMSADTIAGIKNLVRGRIEEIDELNVSWFGGEPLLAYDIVKDICAFSRDIAIAHGAAFTSEITTNGYRLSEERFLELASLGVSSYQISLDGDEQGHDQIRLRVDGAGTFAKIWENLLAFNSTFRRGELPSSNITLRLHVRPGNIDSVMSLCKRIRDQLDPRAFEVNIESVGHYGGANDRDFEILEKSGTEYKNIITAIMNELPGFAPAVGSGVYVCYASKANNFTIRADGSIGKCTVALNSDANRVGKINPDGTLGLDAAKIQPWMRGLSSMNMAELGCPVVGLPKWAITPPS